MGDVPETGMLAVAVPKDLAERIKRFAEAREGASRPRSVARCAYIDAELRRLDGEGKQGDP
jgi:hypothetical protein